MSNSQPESLQAILKKLKVLKQGPPLLGDRFQLLEVGANESEEKDGESEKLKKIRLGGY